MTQATISVFHGPGRPFEFAKRALPVGLLEDEVLVAIDRSSICGSDIHTFVGRRSGPTPCVLGHEGVGRIVEIGPGKKSQIWKPGDRITWSLADSCGVCRPCVDYRLPQKCESLFKYGHASFQENQGLNGCYATHIMLRRGTHLVAVPETILDAAAVSANCALATMVSALETLPSPCREVVIQGAGLLGVYGCAILRERGVERVIVVDRDDARLEWVHQFGGEAVHVNALHQIPPKSVDLVVEASGQSEAIPAGLSILRPGGHYILVGMVHPDSALRLTGEQIIRNSLTLRGVHNYAPRHLDEAIRLLASSLHTLPWELLIAPAFPLCQLGRAFEQAVAQKWHRVTVGPEGLRA